MRGSTGGFQEREAQRRTEVEVELEARQVRE